MPKVRLLTWATGLNKVRLTKRIREAAGIPLNEAHDVVNRFLAGDTVEIAFSSESGAHQFAEEIRGLGVEVQCVDLDLIAK